ncbi:MAG: hypothetical protein ACYTGG_09465, partial [Planctomycetota bacterium]
FQSNLDGPGENGTNPRGPGGLVALGTGFGSIPDKGVSSNTFADSFDLLSLNPNHTAISLRVVSLLGASPVEVRVYDKNEQLVGQTTISATPDSTFIGIFMKNRETFGRINLWSPDAQAEGVLNVEAYINVEEKCPWDCADNNGIVDIVDLLALLAQWNGPGSCDFDGNGVVNIVDLLALLAAWGPCPVCPAPGSCFEPHPNPGCSLQDCCNTVCAADPFCCNIEWDQLCADEASSFCVPAFQPVFDPGGLSQGPYSVEDFEDGAFLPGASYSSGSGIPPTLVLASSFAGNVTPSGVQGLASGTFPDTIRVDFTTPVTSAGLWFGNDDLCCSTGFNARLEAYDAFGLVGTVVLPANMNDFADQFVGFNSSNAITHMIIHFGNDTEGLFIYIDDVYFNN